MTRLKACTSCSRHVFVTELRCPFCATPLQLSDLRPRTILHAGLSRAQRLAFAAAVIQSASACGAASDLGQEVAGQGASGGGGQTSAGSPSVAGSNANAGSGVSTAGSGVALGGSGGNGSGGQVAMPVYGAPFPPAGQSGGGVGGSDMEPPSAALYGASPPPVEDAGTAQDDAGGMAGSGQEPPPAVPLYGASPVPVYGASPPPAQD